MADQQDAKTTQNQNQNQVQDQELGKQSDNQERFQLRQGVGDNLRVVKSVATREEADEELKKLHQERSQALAEINEAYPETTIVDTGVKMSSAKQEGIEAHKTADQKEQEKPFDQKDQKDKKPGGSVAPPAGMEEQSYGAQAETARKAHEENTDENK